MNITIYLQSTSLLFFTILCIVFFGRKTINNIETRFYSLFLIVNLVGLVVDIVLGISSGVMNYESVCYKFIARIYLVYFVTWVALLCVYMYVISRKKKTFFESNKALQRWLIISVIFYAFNIIVVLISPNYFKNTNYGTHSYGLATYYTYGICIFYTVLSIVFIITSKHKIKKIKYAPACIFTSLLALSTVIQFFNPSLIFTPTVMSLTAFIMYFTIENPDVRVINELNRNKTILENNNEERSNLLFRMTQEVRKPISNIDSLVNMIDVENEYVKLEDVVSAIKNNTRQISYVVNNVLDVTDIDVRKIKITNSKYDARRLFEEINLFIKDKIGKNVAYNYYISSEMPKYLYGDYIKLKQAIMSVLINSVENTKKGFIDINISVMIKYDMCRLIITVEDSGVGMNIQQVNDILTLDKQLDEEDEKKLNKMDVDLNISKKIINIIGGSLMIKSEVDKGSEFIIVIDQKIAEEKKIKRDKNLNDDGTVLIMDDDLNLLYKEKKAFSNNSINAVGTMYGLDVINRIRVGEKYDYIILDDDTVKGSAKSVLDELKNISNFDIPVIVMLEKNKENIKEHYLEIGFSDYILKDNLENNIDDFIKKIRN